MGSLIVPNNEYIHVVHTILTCIYMYIVQLFILKDTYSGSDVCRLYTGLTVYPRYIGNNSSRHGHDRMVVGCITT